MIGELRLLPVAQLTPSPTNPRKAFDETKLMELAASLGKQGLLQPIVVRILPEDSPARRGLGLFDERYEIVAGERRYRAAQRVPLIEVPCILTAMSDEEVVEAQVVENAQRDDVSPIEEADAFARLLDMPGYRASDDPVGAVAGRIGRSKSQVYARLKLRSLGKEGRELLANGSMSASVALDVARLQPRDQAKACRALYAPGGEVTLKNARDWIRSNLLLRVADFSFDPGDADLLPMAGPCTTCPKNTAVDPTLLAGESGGKSGLCTDPACHKEQTLAQEDRLIRELTQEHGTCRLISTTYMTPKRKDALRPNEFDVVARTHHGAVPALDVDPSWSGDMFKVRWIHVLDKKKQSQADSDAKAKEGKKVADLFRARLMDEIALAASPVSSDRALLNRFVLAAWRRLGRDAQRRVAQDVGMEPVVKEEGYNAGYKDYSVAADAWVPTMDEASLGRLMLRMVAIGELSASLYSTSSHYEVPPILGGLAQECGVDALARLEEAQESVRPRKLVNLL